MTIQEVKNNFVQNLAENAYINMCSAEEMKIAIQALEKQIPKKPIVDIWRSYCVDYQEFFCPYCRNRMTLIIGKNKKYCDNCGQALDWSENNG